MRNPICLGYLLKALRPSQENIGERVNGEKQDDWQGNVTYSIKDVRCARPLNQYIAQTDDIETIARHKGVAL